MMLAPLTLVFSLVVATSGLAQESTDAILADGKFQAKSSKISGTWKIVEKKEKRTLVLNQGFAADAGPDLKIFLSPKPLKSLTGQNATQGSKRLAALKSNKGAQSYAIPKDLKLESFRSLIVHCEKYSKLWGGSSLVFERVLASGRFEKRGYDIQGTWKVLEKGGTHTLVFNQDFETQSGPDLKIFLSPRSLDKVTDQDALKKATRVGLLKNAKGSQSYELPDSFNASSGGSFIIHCEKFSKLWGGANLPRSARDK